MNEKGPGCSPGLNAAVFHGVRSKPVLGSPQAPCRCGGRVRVAFPRDNPGPRAQQCFTRDQQTPVWDLPEHHAAARSMLTHRDVLVRGVVGIYHRRLGSIPGSPLKNAAANAAPIAESSAPALGLGRHGRPKCAPTPPPHRRDCSPARLDRPRAGRGVLVRRRSGRGWGPGGRTAGLALGSGPSCDAGRQAPAVRRPRVSPPAVNP